MTDETDGAASEPTFLEATKLKKTGLIGDFMSFMSESKKWWLIPFLIVLGLVATVVVLGVMVPGALPWLYPLF